MGVDLDRGAKALQEAGRPGADLIDTGLGVAPAVHVDQGGQVLEVGRQLVLDDLFELLELVRADRRAGRVQGVHSRSLPALLDSPALCD